MFRRVPVCGERCHRYTLLALVAYIVLYSLSEIDRVGPNLAEADAMMISGCGWFALGLCLVRGVPVRLQRAVERLFHRGALSSNAAALNEADLAALKQQLDARSEVWARIVAIGAAAAMLVAYVIAFWLDTRPEKILFTAASVVGAYIAGSYLGRMVGYGQLGRLLDRADYDLVVSPGHVDGAGGLKPVGDFYFFQAMVTAIPAVHLAIWSLLIPFWPTDYNHWRAPYLGLLMIAVTIEIAAFIVPLWSFHRKMKIRKQEWIVEADKLIIRMNKLQNSVRDADDADERKKLKEQLADLTTRYWAIEKMPTWPVDIKTLRIFSLNNLALIAPIIGNFTADPKLFGQIIDLIVKAQIN